MPRLDLRCALVTVAVVGGCHGSRAPQAIDAPYAVQDAPLADAPAPPADGDAGALACPPGSTLLVDRTSCPGALVAPPASLLSTAAAAGDLVPLDGLDEGALPCLPALVCRPASAATMLFSDDPESPASDGVLYADTFGPGHARLYVYHVNGDASARKFPVVVLNQGSGAAHVTITKLGLAAPSTDYVDVGKAVAAAWLASSVSTVVTVPAGSRVLLDATLDAEHATTNELVHAIIDIDVDAPVKLSVVSVLATEDAAALTASLPLLPNDGRHDRGTFPGADAWIVGAAGDSGPSARHLRLGGNVTEPDLTGRDATTGSAATLLGNYGVAYTFDLTASGPLRLAASERGGAWAGALDLAAVAPLPTASGALSTTTDAVWLATLGAGSAAFTLVSGGGSSLPLDLVVLTP